MLVFRHFDSYVYALFKVKLETILLDDCKKYKLRSLHSRMGKSLYFCWLNSFKTIIEDNILGKID